MRALEGVKLGNEYWRRKLKGSSVMGLSKMWQTSSCLHNPCWEDPRPSLGEKVAPNEKNETRTQREHIYVFIYIYMRPVA